MDATNIKLTNFVYQGGDDCVAIKLHSYNIEMRNATCHGGNGMAIGSLGQYLEDASVENVRISDFTVIRSNEDLTNSAYIKTWVGALIPQDFYESGGQPRGADSGPAITQDSGDNGSYTGTNLLDVSNIAFVNFTGYLDDESTTASVSCSKVKPCYNIDFKNISLRTAANETGTGTGEYSYIESGGVHGLNGTRC